MNENPYAAPTASSEVRTLSLPSPQRYFSASRLLFLVVGSLVGAGAGLVIVSWLTDEERAELVQVVKKLKGTSQKVKRAQVLLKADADGPNWTDREIAEAFDCRIQTIEKIRQRLVERGFRETLEGSKREKPPREKLLNGEQEARVIAMRLSSPPKGPVLCMDEQPVQLLKETRTPIPATAKHGRRVDYEYERAGTANIFMFTEPLAGWREVAVREKKTKIDWA
ncbi:MAG TPA: helix-turn-helix domain-containing protein, partial [Pirellulales bacterium]|nr:helix-turn-helix domain-containing protein [Pirellulales bacterium]